MRIRLGLANHRLVELILSHEDAFYFRGHVSEDDVRLALHKILVEDPRDNPIILNIHRGWLQIQEHTGVVAGGLLFLYTSDEIKGYEPATRVTTI
jgi:hypothetical protein